jgi:hypothetical protein
MEMNFAYNIYRRMGSSLCWVERFTELEEARTHVTRLQDTSPGKYLIYDAKSGTMLPEWAERP